MLDNPSNSNLDSTEGRRVRLEANLADAGAIAASADQAALLDDSLLCPLPLSHLLSGVFRVASLERSSRAAAADVIRAPASRNGDRWKNRCRRKECAAIEGRGLRWQRQWSGHRREARILPMRSANARSAVRVANRSRQGERKRGRWRCAPDELSHTQSTTPLWI